MSAALLTSTDCRALDEGLSVSLSTFFFLTRPAGEELPRLFFFLSLTRGVLADWSAIVWRSASEADEADA